MLNRRTLSLIFFQTDAALSVEAERSYAGYAWWVLEPVISMFIHYLVFGVLFDRGTEDFVPFLFVGLIVWRWQSTTIQRGAASILDGRALMQQVYLHKLVFPTVSVLSHSFKFVIVFLILITYLQFAGYRVTPAYLALPVILLSSVLWITALTYVFAAMVPFFPDVRQILDNSLRLIFFLSGVFFAIDSLPEQHQLLLRFNPFGVLIEAFRDVLLSGEFPRFKPMILSNLFSIALIALGALWVHRKDCTYPKLGY